MSSRHTSLGILTKVSFKLYDGHARLLNMKSTFKIGMH